MAYFTQDDRQAMRNSAARFLRERCDEPQVRRLMDLPTAHSPEMWRNIAELGLTGLIIDPDYGGLGGGAVELEMVMEEMGAALLPSPFLASSVIAAALLSHCSDDAVRQRLLPALSTGESIATVALTGPSARWTPASVAVNARRSGGGWSLDGRASHILHAGIADLLLVVGRVDEGLAVFTVDPAAHGLSIVPQQGHDLTSRLYRMELNGAGAERLPGLDAQAIERALDLARIGLAGEQAGGARRMFDMTVDYIKQRVQFGRPVGGFQAIKHMAADLLVEVESAISAARAAAHAHQDAAPDAGIMINLAAFACAEAYLRVTADAIQMHGGIGFTWDHPGHLHFRRARAGAQFLGSPAFYRERYLSMLELAA